MNFGSAEAGRMANLLTIGEIVEMTGLPPETLAQGCWIEKDMRQEGTRHVGQMLLKRTGK